MGKFAACRGRLRTALPKELFPSSAFGPQSAPWTSLNSRGSWDLCAYAPFCALMPRLAIAQLVRQGGGAPRHQHRAMSFHQLAHVGRLLVAVLVHEARGAHPSPAPTCAAPACASKFGAGGRGGRSPAPTTATAHAALRHPHSSQREVSEDPFLSRGTVKGSVFVSCRLFGTSLELKLSGLCSGRHPDTQPGSGKTDLRKTVFGV